MTLIKKIKTLFCNTCLIFSAIVFLTLALWFIISAQKVASTEMLFKQALLSLLFSFIIACLNEILKLRALMLTLRVLIHFVGSMLCFYIFFIKMGTYSQKNSGELIIMLLVALLYIIVTAIVLSILHIRARKKNDNSKYEAQFDFEK